jgi:hypothetical protein
MVLRGVGPTPSKLRHLGRYEKMRSVPLLVCLGVLISASAVSADTWHITPDGTGDAPTIQAGVDSASAGDEVVLADGIYTGPGNRDIGIGGAITVRSESGNPEACVVDCQGSETQPHQGFLVFRAGARLEGVKVINGYAGDEGGAVEAGGGVSIVNCVFENNFGPEGGAVAVYDFNEDGLTTISGCEFIDNEAYWTGGGLSAGWRFTELSLDHCTFIGNSTMWLYGCVIDILTWSDEEVTAFQMTNCTVASNHGGVNGSMCLSTVIERTIIAYNTWSAVGGQYSCCDLFGNDGGDWVGGIAGQYGIRGNFSACPSFCHIELADAGICDQSPCAPGNHPDGYDCGLIGAHDVGCVCGATSTESSTWGAIKSMYR